MLHGFDIYILANIEESVAFTKKWKKG
jgi:hypothetical protein